MSSGAGGSVMAGFGGSVGAGGTGKAAIEGIGAGGSEDHPPFLVPNSSNRDHKPIRMSGWKRWGCEPARTGVDERNLILNT